jgi:hypothetical protein
MTLERSRINIASLTSDQIDAMFNLMKTYYENVTVNDFTNDLKEKDWVLMLHDQRTGEIAGFSTQMLMCIEFQGEELLVLFSGDTIISREHWGTMALGLSLAGLMFDLIAQYPDNKLYWMLISKGLRTYKYLPVCFIEYYPNYKSETPEEIYDLMCMLGKLKFPGSFDEKRGIIRAHENSQFLKKEFQPLPNPSKPHESFFYEMNPGVNSGDELLCLAKLDKANVNPGILRLLSLER